MNKLTAIILILAVLLTGCNYRKTDEMADGEYTEATTEDTTGSETVSTPTSGGTINLSMRKPHTLNPLLNEDVTVDGVLKLMFEPLFVLDDEQNITPNLADAYLLGDDGKSVAVSLRSDAKWSDGTAITADDLVFSLDTIKSASAGSVYKSAMTNVSGYYKTSSTTVIIEYSAPFGGCVYNLCFPVIPKHYYNGYNTITSERSMKPLGDGMYTFSDYRIVRQMTLKAGSNFRGTPYIDTVNVIVMNDKETEINAFEQGLIDVLTMDSGEYGSFSSHNSIDVTGFTGNQFEFLGFNFKNSTLSNKNIRQAIAYAIPMDNIIDNIYLGNAVKSITPVHPNSVLNTATNIDTYDYDLNKAKSLVSQTNFTSEQLTFTILVNQENKERCEIAELIAQELNQIGMHVTVYKVTFADYTKLLQNDSFTLFIGGTEFTPRVDLRTMLLSSSQSSGMNYFNFSDLQMDNLLNACLNTAGDENYKAAVAQLQKYCAAQLPFVGIGFKSQLLLTDSKLKGDKRPAVNDIYRNIGSWYIPENER
jgi:peptide/nickel transport system substrate-binding protein